MKESSLVCVCVCVYVYQMIRVHSCVGIWHTSLLFVCLAVTLIPVGVAGFAALMSKTTSRAGEGNGASHTDKEIKSELSFDQPAFATSAFTSVQF